MGNFKVPWYCKSCIKKSIPFSEVTNDTFKNKLISPNLKNYFSDDETQVSEELAKCIENKKYTPGIVLKLNLKSLQFQKTESEKIGYF